MFNSEKSSQEFIYKGLNPSQKQAVEALNGPVLIIAGAGSGKTKALTHRIANLIYSGVKPYNILALTFTNKAAAEMKERIAHLVSYDEARHIWAGTFHSIFARILRAEAEKIGFSSNFSIYDSDDSSSLIKKIINSNNYSNQKLVANSIKSRISGLKNKLVSPNEFAGEVVGADDKVIADIYKKYEIELRKSNSMDFDDLLTNMIVLLRASKETLNKYQNQFKYLLIDEYQDTNKAQYIAVKMLASAHQNICVVGDDAQSIYKWRGADISNILDFGKDYPYAKIIRLEQNYRSTKMILNAADCIIRKNKNQIPKKLWTENPEGELINIRQCADDREEAFKIANIIQAEVEKGFSHKDIAVLYRTNAQSLTIENSLRARNIPYIIVGGISFYKRKEIKDVLAYITLLINPNDSEALTRAINEPPRGIGLTSLRNLKTHADRFGITLLKACEQVNKIEDVKGKAASSALAFANMVTKYSDLIKTGTTASIIGDYLAECGILEMYNEIGSDESYDRIQNIKQLLSDLSDFLADNEGSDLTDYLQQISLISDLDDKDISGNNVTLMTLHSAKGLEFPVVVIAGMEQGLFPLIRNQISPDEEEEERRLFYVGVTRAKEKLYITYAIRRSKFGETSNQTPSKFLKDIPRELTNLQQSTGVNTSDLKGKMGVFAKPKPKPIVFEDNYSQIPSEENYSQVPVNNTPIKKGDKVRHANFGRGVVVNLTGFGNNQKASVNFEGFGVKVLMLNFAKLQRL